MIRNTAVNAGFYVGSKAFFFLNADQTTAFSTVLQGGMIFSRTEGSLQNSSAWASKAPQLTAVGASTAYDAVWAIADTISRLKTASTPVTRENVRNELKNTNMNSYSGPLSFSATTGYRVAQTYNVTNVFATTPARRLTVPFTWDGALNPATPDQGPRWPGSATVATSGKVVLYPVGFISSMYNNYSEMVTQGNIVPLAVTAQRSLARLSSSIVNAEVLKPYDVQISVPPLNDNGTVSGAVRISTTVSNANAYVAMVATWDSPLTRIIQGVVSAYGVPQIAYAAGDPTLSNKATYPTLIRVSPSDARQAEAILDMVSHYKWTQVSVISTSSSYGQDLEASFGDQLVRYPDIARGTGGLLLDNGGGLDKTLEAMKKANVNIVILFVEPTNFPLVLKTMKQVGYKPRAVIVPDRFFQTYLWKTELEASGYTLSDFAGWIGTVPAGGNTPPGAPAPFRNLTADIAAVSAAAYPGLAEGCAEVPDYCAYVFDSFYIAATAIARTLDVGENPQIGPQLLRHISQVNISQATGPISFDANYDRISSPFVSRYVRKDGTFAQFGNWNDTNGFSQTASVVWPSGSTEVPVAIEPRTVKWLKWKSAPAIVLAAIAGVGILLAIVMTSLLIIWREAPVLVSATLPFLILIMIGAALAFGSMFTWIGEPQKWICALRIWLPPVAFVLMLAPLLAKTWRLHRIFSLATLKTTPIPLWKLVVMVICLCLVQVAICIAWIAAGTIEPQVVNDKQDTTNSYKICTQSQANRICSYVTYGYLGALLLVGAYYAFRVRNLPKDFNESRWIGFSIYNTLLFSIIIVILGYALVEFRVTVLILICVCTLAITFGILSFMMAPKLWDLIMNPNRRSASSGAHTYSGSSPQSSKFHGSYRSDPGNAANGDSPRGSTTPHKRHDFSRRRGERSSHSGNSKDAELAEVSTKGTARKPNTKKSKAPSAEE